MTNSRLSLQPVHSARRDHYTGVAYLLDQLPQLLNVTDLESGLPMVFTSAMTMSHRKSLAFPPTWRMYTRVCAISSCRQNAV